MEHPQPRPVLPRALSLPLPSPPAGHMEPISLVTLKSRPCARLPFRHGAPGAPAPRRGPRQSRRPFPATRPALRAPSAARCPAGPAQGDPRRLQRGAPRVRPRAPRRRPAASKAEQSRGRGRGRGAGRASGPLPASARPSQGRPGLNDRDAAGRAPAGAEGPEPGRWLPRAPRARRPGAACALAGAAQVSVGAGPAPGAGRGGAESRAAETPSRPLSWVGTEAGSKPWETKMRATSEAGRGCGGRGTLCAGQSGGMWVCLWCVDGNGVRGWGSSPPQGGCSRPWRAFGAARGICWGGGQRAGARLGLAQPSCHRGQAF